MDLRGSVSLVTGGNGGLGRRISRALAESLLGRAADRDHVADQVVTFARTDSTTGQTMVIDAGRFFH